MAKTISYLQHWLMMTFWTILTLTLLITVLLRTTDCCATLQVISNPVVEYVVDMVAVCLTIALVPLALRLMYCQSVRRKLPEKYARWAWTRQLLLQSVFAIDAVCYGLFDKASYFYLAIISLLAMIFVYVRQRQAKAKRNEKTLCRHRKL